MSDATLGQTIPGGPHLTFHPVLLSLFLSSSTQEAGGSWSGHGLGTWNPLVPASLQGPSQSPNCKQHLRDTAGHILYEVRKPTSAEWGLKIYWDARMQIGWAETIVQTRAHLAVL